MKGACEGLKASLPVKVLIIGLLILLFAGCNHYYTSQLIHIQDGIIYKQGQSDPFTGRILDTLYNNILEYDVVNGIKTGEYSVTDFNGNFSIYGNLKGNKNDGLWIYFYENGKVESKGNFKDDQPQGKWNWFYKNGKMRAIGYYVNGIKEGRWIYYNTNGNPSKVIDYSKDAVLNEVNYFKFINI